MAAIAVVSACRSEENKALEAALNPYRILSLSDEKRSAFLTETEGKIAAAAETSAESAEANTEALWRIAAGYGYVAAGEFETALKSFESAFDKLHGLTSYPQFYYYAGVAAASQAKQSPIESQKALLFDTRCENQSKIECMSFSHVFDWFTSELIDMCTDGHVPTSQELQMIRNVFVQQLSTMMLNSFRLFQAYTRDQLNNEIIIQSVLMSTSIIIFLFLFFFIIFPAMKRIDETLCSVKIPMKLIHPYNLVEIPKLIQYLRGECDWSDDSPTSDKGKEKAVGDLILNVMGSPLGVFGSDLSLLVANSEFYSLLNTSREACVGLPMNDIFSTCMNFERDETHPFNSVLQTVSQLQRGISPVNQIEINCDLEIQGKGKKKIFFSMINF